jgi:LysR family hydrogen peroxide-inducible transcriptional activator
MEIDQLRYFLKVAECGNYTRAAEELAVTQPTLSRSIQKLEEELGQPVFERKSRSIELTDVGRLLQSRAIEALSILDDTKAELTDDGKSGRLRVGAIPTIAPYFLPRVLRQFAHRFPKASVMIYENTTDNLLKNCRQGDVDLAVLALPFDTKHLAYEVLFEEELSLVLPQDHELLKKKKITASDIQHYPFVLLDEAHCLTDSIVSFCKQRSFQPVSVESTNQLATVLELVSLSHGISLIPEMTRQCDTSHSREYRSLAGIKPMRTVVLVWNPYRFQSRLSESFRKMLSSVVA